VAHLRPAIGRPRPCDPPDLACGSRAVTYRPVLASACERAARLRSGALQLGANCRRRRPSRSRAASLSTGGRTRASSRPSRSAGGPFSAAEGEPWLGKVETWAGRRTPLIAVGGSLSLAGPTDRSRSIAAATPWARAARPNERRPTEETANSRRRAIEGSRQHRPTWPVLLRCQSGTSRYEAGHAYETDIARQTSAGEKERREGPVVRSSRRVRCCSRFTTCRCGGDALRRCRRRPPPAALLLTPSCLPWSAAEACTRNLRPARSSLRSVSKIRPHVW
jgi:hypothetical protein